MMSEADDISWLGVQSFHKLRCARRCHESNSVWSEDIYKRVVREL